MTQDSPARPARKAAPAGKKPPEHLAAWRGVWVFVELERGRVHPVSWELLGEGRKLADTLSVDVGAVLLGPPDPAMDEATRAAFTYGADTVYRIDDPVLEHYRTDPYTKGLSDLVREFKPEALLLGATPLGRDLAGAVATTLATGLTADCTELAIDPETRGLASTRPTFGGSLLCTIQTMHVRPQMATIRPRVMAMPEPEPARAGTVVTRPLGMAEDEVVTKVLDYVPDAQQDKAQLAYAEVVVAGGRGMGSPENFELIKRLAEALGAEFGGSRPLVQQGWIGADRQIGQTGKTIRPKLYIACGISGAVQHRVGVEGADTILAINTDPDAPIFDFAHYGIVGDALEIVPALIRYFEGRPAHALTPAALADGLSTVAPAAQAPTA